MPALAVQVRCSFDKEQPASQAPVAKRPRGRPRKHREPDALADRRHSNASASTSGSSSTKDIAESVPLPPATELIFRLDRRGVGWGEEILPHLTVEQRILKRNRSAQPDPWTVSLCGRLLRAV